MCVVSLQAAATEARHHGATLCSLLGPELLLAINEQNRQNGFKTKKQHTPQPVPINAVSDVNGIQSH